MIMLVTFMMIMMVTVKMINDCHCMDDEDDDNVTWSSIPMKMLLYLSASSESPTWMLRVSMLLFRAVKIMLQLLASSLIPCQQTTGRLSEVVTASSLLRVTGEPSCKLAGEQDMRRQVRVSTSHMLTCRVLNWN